jgi:hypothetical protein
MKFGPNAYRIRLDEDIKLIRIHNELFYKLILTKKSQLKAAISENLVKNHCHICPLCLIDIMYFPVIHAQR